MLPDEIGPGTNDTPEHERDKHRVVEQSENGNEIRDEVERQREVRKQRCDQDLVPALQAVIPQEPREENDAIGDEAGNRTGVFHRHESLERKPHDDLVAFPLACFDETAARVEIVWRAGAGVIAQLDLVGAVLPRLIDE
jgi:hypothetical protein